MPFNVRVETRDQAGRLQPRLPAQNSAEPDMEIDAGKLEAPFMDCT